MKSKVRIMKSNVDGRKNLILIKKFGMCYRGIPSLIQIKWSPAKIKNKSGFFHILTFCVQMTELKCGAPNNQQTIIFMAGDFRWNSKMLFCLLTVEVTMEGLMMKSQRKYIYVHFYFNLFGTKINGYLTPNAAS